MVVRSAEHLRHETYRSEQSSFLMPRSVGAVSAQDWRALSIAMVYGSDREVSPMTITFEHIREDRTNHSGNGI